MKYNPLKELIVSRVKEFFREPEAIFWVYVFPIILAGGLGLAFRDQPPPDLVVGIVAEEQSAFVKNLGEIEGFSYKTIEIEAGKKEVTSGKIDLLVVPPKPATGENEARDMEYIFDPAQIKSLLAKERFHAFLQKPKSESDAVAKIDTHLQEPGSRYIDFLLPGIIGMNLLGGGLFGIGFAIVDMRVRKLLKRFLATPMKKAHFFIAVLFSRMVFLVPEMGFLLAVAILGFGLPMNGNWLALFTVILVGSLSFSGIGLLVATRARKLETISGLMNLIMLPMWLLGGIFFTTERFPDAIQPIVQALPLTAVNDALRGVILEGSSLFEIYDELLILGGWGAFGFLLSLKLFRWI